MVPPGHGFLIVVVNCEDSLSNEYIGSAGANVFQFLHGHLWPAVLDPFLFSSLCRLVCCLVHDFVNLFGGCKKDADYSSDNELPEFDDNTVFVG